ncbi:transcriptional regulators domain protein [Escherichia coli DEC6B]|nr:transcriptional regulators domain protein [Escherichia coli DEC6B]
MAGTLSFCCPAAGRMGTGYDDVPVTQPGGAVIPAQLLYRVQS